MPKEIKFQMMLAEEQMTRVNDWQFHLRIKSTAEAIRQLIDLGLEAHAKGAAKIRAKAIKKDGDTPLSTRIRSIRSRLGLSQQELADALGAPQSAVSKWETGADKPSVEYWLSIQEMEASEAPNVAG